MWRFDNSTNSKVKQLFCQPQLCHVPHPNPSQLKVTRDSKLCMVHSFAIRLCSTKSITKGKKRIICIMTKFLHNFLNCSLSMSRVNQWTQKHFQFRAEINLIHQGTPPYTTISWSKIELEMSFFSCLVKNWIVNIITPLMFCFLSPFSYPSH